MSHDDESNSDAKDMGIARDQSNRLQAQRSFTFGAVEGDGDSFVTSCPVCLPMDADSMEKKRVASKAVVVQDGLDDKGRHGEGRCSVPGHYHGEKRASSMLKKGRSQ